MSKLTIFVAGLAALPVLALGGIANATNGAQIEAGNMYRVRNVTTNTDYVDPVDATCNDTVQFKVRIHNVGTASLSDVKVVATLPSEVGNTFMSKVTVSTSTAEPGSVSDAATVKTDKAAKLQYVAGSAELLSAASATVDTVDDAIVSSGIDLGNTVIGSGDKRFVQFDAKVTCDTPAPATPVYTCDAFAVTSDNATRTVKVTDFEYTSRNGATFKNVHLNWGDNSSELVADKATGQSHQYAKVGTYKVTATPHFMVNGKEQSASNATNCSKSVTFRAAATPAAPTTGSTGTGDMPTTGPGQVFGLFVSVSLAAAAAHRVFLNRLFARR